MDAPSTARVVVGVDFTAGVARGSAWMRDYLVPGAEVVAVDDAGLTPRVLTTAGALADRLAAEIQAVHVLSNAAYSHVLSAEAATASAEGASDNAARQRVEADMAREALRWLSELWRSTTRHARLGIEIPHGDPGTEILALAARTDAELIVIGRYGAGRVLPAVLGSVLSSVVFGATCPVLVVSDPPQA